MFLRKANTLILSLGNRVYLLYFIAIIAVVALTDTKAMFMTMKLRVLNRLMPSLEFLVNDKEYPQHKNKWEDFAYYYAKVSRYVPVLSNAYFMSGYSQYQLGNLEQAKQEFQKSIELNPHFFWAHYNLGIVQFENGQWEQAAESFDRALTTKMDTNMKIILLSKVHQQIITVNKISHETIAINLQQGMVNAALMKVKCLVELEENNEALALANKIIELKWDTRGQALYYAGLAALRLNKVPLAIYYFRECVQKNKQFAQSYHYLGNLLRDRSESDLAQKLLAQAEHLERQGVSPLRKSLKPRIY